MTFHIVYKTTNLINGKIYIGKHSTDDLNDGYKGSGDKLKLAFIKHGYGNFICEPIFFAFSEQFAYDIESEIVTKEFISSSRNYNCLPGGKGALTKEQHFFYGMKHKDSTKQKMSLASSGEKNHQWGKVGARTGATLSDETKAKMSLSAGNGEMHHLYGTTLTVEHRLKISKGIAGDKHPQFGKKGEDSVRFGQTHSEESIAKMRISKTGHKHSDETKEKLSKPQEKVQCSYCGKIGGSRSMTRYHFENCKERKNE